MRNSLPPQVLLKRTDDMLRERRAHYVCDARLDAADLRRELPAHHAPGWEHTIRSTSNTNRTTTGGSPDLQTTSDPPISPL